jgi:hypothetical protein
MRMTPGLVTIRVIGAACQAAAKEVDSDDRNAS